MKKSSKPKIIIIVAALTAAGILGVFIAPSVPIFFGRRAFKAKEWKPRYDGFVTVNGDKLMLGGEEFRFISFNVPNLHIIEDPYWHLPTEFEQEDAVKTVKEMGGRVIRIYTLSVISDKDAEKRGSVTDSHIKGVNGELHFNEEYFAVYDRMLDIAARHDIKLILPILDNWDWFGGKKAFASISGNTREEFYTGEAVRANYKKVVDYLLNRVNTVNGKVYKEDPAILCWELGNELRGITKEWKNEMSAYIKSIDPDHLIMDGEDKVTQSGLASETIDILTAHFYPGSINYARRARQQRRYTKGVKPLVIGEFGLAPTENMSKMVDEVVSNGTSGALIWSLRFRSKAGGFYYHTDSNKYVNSGSYHFPGFAENASYDEIAVMLMMRNAAFKIQGKEIPPTSAPSPAPVLRLVDGGLSWRGSTGATFYQVLYSPDGDNWDYLDIMPKDIRKNAPLFRPDAEGWYIIRAANSEGCSEWSDEVYWAGE